MSLQSRERAVLFIQNFVVQHAVVLPGRVPSYKNPDLLLLPSEYTKKSVHESNVASITDDEDKLPYSTFTEIWRQFLPTTYNLGL